MKMFWKIGVALSIIFPIVLLTTSRPADRLAIESSFIWNEQFAVVETITSGADKLYLGNINGTNQISIESANSLSAPSIDNAGRVLLVEGIRGVNGDTPTFRLLRIENEGVGVKCEIIVQSKKYIGRPIAPTGRLSGSLMFLTGEYNADSDNMPVTEHFLTMLNSGKVSNLKGRTFLSIGRLTEILDGVFLAVYCEKAISADKLVKIELTGGEFVATPLKFNGAIAGDPWTVTADQASAKIYVNSYQFNNGPRKDFVSEVAFPSMQVITVHELPKERNYSNFFLIKQGQEPSKLVAFSVPSRGVNEAKLITVSYIESDGFHDSVSFALEPLNKFSTDQCLVSDVGNGGSGLRF